jgi:cell division transport system permease protein
MKFTKFFYLIKEGLKNIFTYGFMSFASVTIILACLVIMGSFGLLSININGEIEKLENENEVLALVDEELSEFYAIELQSSIEAIPNVASVQFISRDEAMNSYADGLGQTDMQGITPDVFRHRFVIYMDDISLTAQTSLQVADIEGIAEVVTHIEIVNAFITVRNIVSAVSLILAAILLIVSLFIMTNTIKLATFSRREEIAIMKMVGASNGFIRFPFVIEGMALGLIGSGLAFLAEWGLYTLVCDRIAPSLAGQLVDVISFSVLMLPLLLAYLIVGLMVGVFGSMFAIRNYLKV